jgi:hypothetical protein
MQGRSSGRREAQGSEETQSKILRAQLDECVGDLASLRFSMETGTGGGDDMEKTEEGQLRLEVLAGSCVLANLVSYSNIREFILNSS